MTKTPGMRQTAGGSKRARARDRGAARSSVGTRPDGNRLSSRSARTWAIAAGIACLTLLAFWPATGNQFLNWDDSGYVTENYLIRDLSPHGIGAIFSRYVEGNYHPLTMLSLAFDYHLWQLRPEGYHVTSMVLHVLATLLVFALALALTGSRAAAAFVALLFGIHPMHVESVAWVSGRKDIVYTIFYVAGCLAWLRWIRPSGSRPQWYAASLGCFLLSLLAKGMAVTFPGALFLLDYETRRRVSLRRSLLEKAPFFALALVLGVVAVLAQKAKGALPSGERLLPIPIRLLVACHGLVAYLAKGLLPIGQSGFYAYPTSIWSRIPLSYAVAPFLVVALAIGIWLLRRSRGVVFGALFYLLNLVLVLQLFPVGSAALADRYTYLSYVGFALALAEGFRLLAGPLAARSAALRSGLALVLAVCAVALVIATRARCGVWSTSERLWSDVIRGAPELEMAYMNRAVAERDAGRDDEAAADLELALRLNPKDAEAWCNRGNIRFSRAQLDSALSDLDTAIRLNGRSPVSRNSRGAVYFRLGRLESALADFDSALALRDAYPEAHLNRGNTFSMLARYDRAAADYDAYMTMERGNPMAYYWRGLARTELGNRAGAAEDFGAAIRLNPKLAVAWTARARAREAGGDRAGALGDALEARALGDTAVHEDWIARLRGSRP